MENESTTEKKETDANQGANANNVTPNPAAQGANNKFKQWLYKQVWEPINWSHVLQLAGLIVGMGVAYIYWNQLVEMTTQTRLLGEQASRAVIEYAGNSAAIQQQLSALKQANDITIESNRPWIAYITPPSPQKDFDFQWTTDKDGVWALVSYTWFSKNGGKRPAQIEKTGTTARWEDAINCSTHPDYNFLPPDSHFFPPRNLVKEKGGEILLSDDTDRSTVIRYIPKLEWEDLESRRPKHVFCVYAFVEYRDVSYPKILHRTQVCRFYGTLAASKFAFADCTNGYGKAD
jgi:hypothetical protein